MLSEKFPGYMVPKIFIYLDEMPLTQNGNVDKKALPTPSEESSLFDSNTISDLALQIDFSLKQDEIKSQLKNAKQLI